MDSPTQKVVGNSIPKPLIGKGLLKSYGTWSCPLFQNLQPILGNRMIGPHKYMHMLPRRNEQ